MERYGSYKDSGVEWIGEIPGHWEIIRICYMFIPTSIKNTDGEINLSVYRDYGVIPRDSRDDNHNIVSEDISNYKLVEVGDFVMNKMKCWMGSLGLSEFRGIVSPSYTVMKPLTNNNSGYLHFLLRSPIYIPQYRRLSYGVRIGQWDMRFEDFRELPCVIPPLNEQQQIVSYLDEKTSLIDSLIEKTQRKIELLKEKRTFLINEVVTKGLNPNVGMMDSGVEWIGEIPSHWEKVSLGKIGILYGGLTGKSGDDFRSDDNPMNKPFIPFTNIFNNTYISKDHFQNVVFGENENQNKVKKFDLFFLMSSEDYDDLGKSSILIEEVDELYLNSFCKGFRVERKGIFPLFLNYQLSGYTHKKLISINGNGFTRINLRQDRLKETPIFIPPLNEQQQIVSYLDEKTSLTNKTVSIEEKRIELLKEYRQSLISEVVTGKIKVITDE